MKAEELLTKFILGTVIDEDCQAYTQSAEDIWSLIRKSRKVLEEFGFEVTTDGTQLGPNDYSWVNYKYFLAKTQNGDGYRLMLKDR